MSDVDMETDLADAIYGFYDRLKADFPSQVIVDTTEVCNLACIHCPHPTFKKSEFYSARYLEPELNAKMIDEVANYRSSVQYIRYTSEGEPLVHPQAFDMMRYARDHAGVPITLTTNGKRMPQKFVDQLIDLRLDAIDISIDAFTHETYAKVRVNGNLEVTRGNVQNLIRCNIAAGRPTKIVVSYIEQPENAHETADFRRFWKDEGADYVVVRKLHSAAGAKTDISMRMWSETTANSRRPCVYPWERVVLNPRGFISFCPADWTHGSTMTNFRTTTLAALWQGEQYRKLREAHLTNDFSNHKFCGQCPDWKTTSWPGRGRGYADMVQELTHDGPQVQIAAAEPI